MLLRFPFAVAFAAVGSAAAAQSPPAVHSLGPVLSTSVEPLGAVSQVRALPGGRVIVNDNSGRRVVMFDSTFKKFTVIADSTSGTSNAYGSRIGGIIAYHGDSTLFVDPVSLSMLVIDGGGKIVRTMAVPRSGDVSYMIGGPFGTPAFDSRGKLLYRQTIRVAPRTSASAPMTQPADSALLVRFDFASRSLDTVVKFAIPQIRYSTITMQVRDRTVSGTTSVINPIPWTDDWAVLSDGTIAIVRGREYRVDLIGVDGRTTSAPKIPFDWQRLTDEAKAAILDSTKAEYDKLVAARLAQRAATMTPDSSKARLGAAAPVPPPPLVFVTADEMADYRPPFRQGAARGDADGKLWIRTTTIVNGGAVYDVIDNKGMLVDRVQVPPGRVIAGFGADGVVYMGVVDGNITRLERARVH